MDPLRCAQLNTHHCKAAMAHLSLYTGENKVNILFIQELYCYDGVPCCTPPDYLAFCLSSDTHPRTSLLNRREIVHNFILLHQFSNPDIIILVTSTNPQIHTASSYLPPYGTLEQDLTPIGFFSNFRKSKGIPQQVELVLGVPGRLRPRIFSTFGTTRVGDRQPTAPAAFTSGKIPGTRFQRLSRPQGTWFFSEGAKEKIPSDTTGDRFQDHPTNSAEP